MTRVLLVLAILAGAPLAAVAAGLDDLARNASCLIESNSVVKLTSPLGGTLAKVEVVRGARVKAGDPVGRIESDIEQVMLEAAEAKAASTVAIEAKEAEVRALNSKLERVRTLAAKSVASTQQLEDAIVQAEVARLGLDQARFERRMAEIEARRIRVTIERRTIRSPVDGVVTRVDLHAGEFVDPQQTPIAIIAETEPLLVQLYLPAPAFPLVREGAPVEVRPAEPIGGTYRAVVATRDPQIDAASNLFQVTLRLPNPEGAVPAGLRCSVRFLP